MTGIRASSLSEERAPAAGESSSGSRSTSARRSFPREISRFGCRHPPAVETPLHLAARTSPEKLGLLSGPGRFGEELQVDSVA